MNASEMTVNQIAQDIKARGGKLAGVLVSLSVPDSLVVPLGLIQIAILNNGELDSSWAPQMREPISLYLDAMRAISLSGKQGFDGYIDQSVCGFYPEQHEGYIVKKAVARDRYSNTPCSHTVFHCYKKPDQDLLTREINQFMADEDEDDEFSAASLGLAPAASLIQKEIGLGKKSKVQVEGDGLTITLVRTKGTYADDKQYRSEFALKFQTSDGGDQVPPRYIPFVNRLNHDFNMLTNLTYTGSQIRDLMKKIIREKINAQPVNGWYFSTSTGNVSQLFALQQVLAEISPLINMIIMPVEIYNTTTSQNSAMQLSKGITDSISKDLEVLYNEIVAMQTSTTKTREGTWAARYQDYMALDKKVKEYNTADMIYGEVLNNQLLEIKGLFVGYYFDIPTL